MFVVGLFFCALTGASLAVFISGIILVIDGNDIGGVLIPVGVNICWIAALIGFALLAGSAAKLQHRIDVESGTFQTALAKIETSHASGEGPDFHLSLDLTIAPDTRSAFRCQANTTVNLMNTDSYRVGRIIVVEFDAERPWRVREPKTVSPEWSSRSAMAALDSAPEATRETQPADATGVPGRAHPYRPGVVLMNVALLATLVLTWNHYHQ